VAGERTEGNGDDGKREGECVDAPASTAAAVGPEVGGSVVAGPEVGGNVVAGAGRVGAALGIATIETAEGGGVVEVGVRAVVVALVVVAAVAVVVVVAEPTLHANVVFP